MIQEFSPNQIAKLLEAALAVRAIFGEKKILIKMFFFSVNTNSVLSNKNEERKLKAIS